jgi:hypothetical protein
MAGAPQGAAEAPRVALGKRVNDIEIGEGKLGGHWAWLLLDGYDVQKQPHDWLGRRGGMGRNGELKWPGIYSPSLIQRLMANFAENQMDSPAISAPPNREMRPRLITCGYRG